MKKMRYGMIFIVLIVMGCASFSSPNTDRWVEFEIHPSRVNNSGVPFFDGRFSDGTGFSIVHDRSMSSEDRRFYYTRLMQDFGWRLDGNTWRGPSTARDTNLGSMYVNPRRRVGIYFHPAGGYSVFRVTVENETNP